jgi:transcriptional regulator with XRE-family HTH domain
MTTILDQPETTSALPGSIPTAEIGVATGLLVSPDFGTSTGVVARRRLRPVGFVVTGDAVIEPLRPENPAADVRALRDRIASHALSKQEIARAIGVDRRSLSGFAKGDIRPSRERLEMLRTLADLADAVAMERPGRVREVLLTRRGRIALIDQLATSGRSILATWRAWVARSEAIVTVTPRAAVRAEPVWAAAARALTEGRLSVPPRARTVRAESAYETDLGEAAAFAEPDYRSRRRGYR